MNSEYRFNCPLPNGLHARPASHLSAFAAGLAAHCELVNERTGARAGLDSVLDIVAAAVLDGDPCVLHISGANAAQALAAFEEYIAQVLPGLDQTLPAPQQAAVAKLPRVLAAEETEYWIGMPASPGVAAGRVVQLGAACVLPAVDALPPSSGNQYELALFNQAVEKVLLSLERQAQMVGGELSGEVAQALLALARDPALQHSVTAQIKEGASAAAAVVQAINSYCAKLLASGSAYLADRVPDLQDIGLRLLYSLPGIQVLEEAVQLTEPSVICARNLPAGQFLALPREQIAGMVLGEAGLTSHAVILARSYGVPCVAGLDNLARITHGHRAVVDGNRGLVLMPVTAAVERFVAREHEIEQRRAAAVLGSCETTARTRDGVRIEVGANIATADEAYAALLQGAEGVGLFRTELLFSSKAQPPSEEEQYEIFKTAALALDGRPLIIRTLDIGGDKPLPYLNLPREKNPFLGYRGIRMYDSIPELITAQVRAIVRASAHGAVRIMAPMVSSVAEARWLRERVRHIQAELRGADIAFDPAMPVGVMVEVPSAALIVPQLSTVVDFFSVGTNDLTQYTLAVDRGNPQVAQLYQELHPAVLRSLSLIAGEAAAYGKWAGICGELARQPEHAPLLVGLGFTELSMSVPAIAAVKAAVARCTLAECQELAQHALACESPAAVAAILMQAAQAQEPHPLTSIDLIEFDSDCRTKAEAIRGLCGLAYLTGRSQDIDELEQAVWAREETYSTGLGYGFAIPHCKSAAIKCGTLALLKLRDPIEWGSLDGRPVQVVILLAMPEADTENTHLKVFAKLARKMMHEEFRDGLAGAGSAQEILARLSKDLELNPEVVTHGT